MTKVADQIHRFVERFRRPVVCSACHHPCSSDRRLISGPSVYICESCVSQAAAGLVPVQQSGLCSFCAHPDQPVVGSWPQLCICGECVRLAQGMLTRDRYRDPAI